MGIAKEGPRWGCGKGRYGGRWRGIPVSENNWNVRNRSVSSACESRPSFLSSFAASRVAMTRKPNIREGCPANYGLSLMTSNDAGRHNPPLNWLSKPTAETHPECRCNALSCRLCSFLSRIPCVLLSRSPFVRAGTGEKFERRLTVRHGGRFALQTSATRFLCVSFAFPLRFLCAPLRSPSFGIERSRGFEFRVFCSMESRFGGTPGMAMGMVTWINEGGICEGVLSNGFEVFANFNLAKTFFHRKKNISSGWTSTIKLS